MCPAGRFKNKKNLDNNKASIACDLCDPGMFQHDVGMSKCIPCSPGYYISKTGSTSCNACPAGFSQPSSHATACIACKQGLYTPHRLWKCQECISGGSCEGPVTWNEVYAKDGYYRVRNVPYGADSGIFVKCATVEPEACLGVSDSDLTPHGIDSLSLCTNFNDAQQRHGAQLVSIELVETLRVPNSQCNLSNHTICITKRSSTERCNEKFGYKDDCSLSGDSRKQCRLCSRCLPGYVMDITGKCEKCSENEEGELPWATLSTIGVLFLAMLAIIGLLSLEVLDHSNIALEKQAEASDALKKIFINYVQIISMALTFELNWGPEVKNFLSVQRTLASGGIDTTVFNCLLSQSVELNNNFHSFVQLKHVIFLTMPVAVLAFVTIGWHILTRCKFDFARRLAKERQDYLIMSYVLILYILYPSMVAHSASLLSCVPIPSFYTRNSTDMKAVSQESLIYNMASDLETKCWSSEHMFLVLLISVPGMAFYGFALPIAAFCLLKRRKQAGSLHTRQGDLRFSLLYAGYKNSRYWFEGVIAFRKFTIVIISVLSHHWTPRMQAASIFLIISCSVIVQMQARPYIESDIRQKRLHAIEIFNLFCCFITFMLGFCITYTTGTRPDGREDIYFLRGNETQTIKEIVPLAIAFKMGIIIINTVFVAILMQQLISSVRDERKKKRERRLSVKHNKTKILGNGIVGRNMRLKQKSFASRIAGGAGTNTVDFKSETDEIARNHEHHERKLMDSLRDRQKNHRVRVERRLAARRKIKAAGCLTRVPMFQSFKRDHLDQIVDSMEFAEFEEGDTLVHQGAVAKTFYVIVSGECEVMVKSLTSALKSVRVASLREFQHFGESALIATNSKTSGLRTASVVATTQGSVLMLSQERFTALAIQGIFGPEFASKILAQFRKRMRFNRAAEVWRNSHSAKSLRNTRQGKSASKS